VSLQEGSLETTTTCDIDRYASLGLIANPFVVPSDADDEATVASEIAAAGNQLLKAVHERSLEEAPRPLVVFKGEVPAQYPLQALSVAEHSFATDEALGILHAYIPLFSMRIGAVRSTLTVVAERLAFRDFESTLIAYVESILRSPDESLDAYRALGPGILDAFEAHFAQSGPEAVRSVFGAGALELHPELAEVADLRHADLAEDVSDESDSSDEIDASLGDAPATAILAAQAQQRADETSARLFDYFAAYTAEHVSPVIARALRVYRDRGLVAFAAELRVTKAPRKTLSAILKFARIRFRTAALIYDGFDSWLEVPDDTRSALVGSLSEMRWKTAGLAFPVFVLTPGEAPEIEETFGASGVIRWDFRGLFALQEEPGVILPEVIDGWLDAASVAPGALSSGDGVLAELRGAAQGSFDRFVRMAHAAVESAASRGIGTLDDAARAAGMAVGG